MNAMFLVRRMLINRDILGSDLCLIEEDGRRFYREEFITLIDRWNHFLKGRFQSGDCVALYANNSVLTYSLAFALWENGICFYGDSFKDRILQRAVSKVKVKAIFLDEINHIELRDTAHDPQYPFERIPSLREFEAWPQSTSRPKNLQTPQDPILIGFTSGSVSECKTVFHTHSSLLAPSAFMAQNYYQSSDSVLTYLNLNHLGYVSCILLAILRAGCDVHILNCNFPDIIGDKLKQGNVNVVPLFSYNWFQILRERPDVSLKNIERVITGGDLVSQEFSKSVLAHGAQKIINVYGLTEALPPVSVKVIDSQNLQDYNGRCLGELAPYVEVQIREGEILVKGENQGLTDWPELITADGYIKTGDDGYVDGNELYIVDRKKHFIEIDGREVSSADIRYYLRGITYQGQKLQDYAFHDGFDLLMVEGKSVLAIAEKQAGSLEHLSLDLLSHQLSEFLGAEFRLDDLLIKGDLPFNGIKLDRSAIRELVLQKWRRQIETPIKPRSGQNNPF